MTERSHDGDGCRSTPRPAGHQHPEGVELRSGSGVSIRLVLADDHLFRRSAGRSSKTRPHSGVAEAGDGDQALAITLSQRPYIILLDLDMPVKTASTGHWRS